MLLYGEEHLSFVSSNKALTHLKFLITQNALNIRAQALITRVLRTPSFYNFLVIK